MIFKSKQCDILIQISNSACWAGPETAPEQSSQTFWRITMEQISKNMTERFSIKSNLEQFHACWVRPEAAAGHVPFGKLFIEELVSKQCEIRQSDFPWNQVVNKSMSGKLDRRQHQSSLPNPLENSLQKLVSKKLTNLHKFYQTILKATNKFS